MTLEELKYLKCGDEIARNDGATGFVMLMGPDRVDMLWVDGQGRRSTETLAPSRLLKLARVNVAKGDEIVRVRIAR